MDELLRLATAGLEFGASLQPGHPPLALLPILILLIASPLCIRHCHTRPPAPEGFEFRALFKMSFALSLISMEAMILIPGSKAYMPQFNVSILASYVSCIAASYVFMLLYAEHRGIVRLSSLIAVYLTVCLPLDAARAHRYYSQGANIFGRHSIIIAGFKLALLAANGISSHPAYVLISSMLSLFREAFYDQSEFLGPELSLKALSEVFSIVWSRKRPSSYRLVKSCLHALNRQILAAVMARVCFTAFLLAQPFLALDVVVRTNGLSTAMTDSASSVKIFILVYIGVAVTRAVHTQLNDRLRLMLRGMLSGEVCKKAMYIHSSRGNGSKLVKLLDSEIEGAVTGLLGFLDVCNSTMQVLPALYLLWKMVGPISLLVAISPLLSVTGLLWLDTTIHDALHSWTEKTHTRVYKAFQFLTQMKGLKLLSLESVVSKEVASLHSSEMQAFARYRFWAGLPMAAGTLVADIAPAFVLAGICALHETTAQLSVVDVFPTMAFVAYIMNSLAYLPHSFGDVLSGLRCTQRIQTFLHSKEVVDASPANEYQAFQNSAAPDKDALDQLQYSIFQMQTRDWQLCGRRFCQTGEAAQLRRQGITAQFRNSSLASLDGRMRLHNVDITIRRSEVTVVLGPPHSGKSTFLRAILGEANICTGSLHVAVEEISYCGHNPWIRNTSIRDNIIGPAKFDREWYNTIVDACMLRLNFNQMPGGDRFIAGTNGANLGAQVKHRVALARCLYARAPITLLDDVFSSLDARTAKTIYRRLFDRKALGIFDQMRSAIILTTTSVDNRLAANQLLLIDELGNAVTQNSNSGIALNNNYINTLRRRVEPAGDADSAADGQQTIQIDLTADKEVSGEKLSIHSSYFRLLSLPSLALFLLLMVLISVAQNAPGIYLRLWPVLGMAAEKFLGNCKAAAVGCALASILFSSFFHSRVVATISADFYHLLLESISGSTLSSLTSKNLQAALNGASSDMTNIGTSLPLTIVQFASCLVIFAIDNSMIIMAAKQTAIPLVCTTVAFYVVQRYLRASLRQREYHLRETKMSIFSHCVEISDGSEYIRGLGWQSSTTAGFWALLTRFQTQLSAKYATERRSRLVADLLSLAAAVTVIVATPNLAPSTQAVVAMSLILLVTYSNSTVRLVELMHRLESDLSAIVRFNKFIQQNPVEERLPDIELPPKWPHKGVIELRNVTARYRSSPISPLALNNVSIDTDPEMKLGITGPSGSGKTSLFLALLNFLDYTGTIVIDDVDISTVPRSQLRTRITTITPNDIKLGGSVRDNLLPFAGQQDDETINEWLLYEALDQVGLWEKVDAAGGYDAPISKLQLTRAERHLLCIARAMLQRLHTQSKLVLMDEPMSCLDNDAAAMVQEVMDEAFLECTVLTAAESESSLPVVDMLLGLDDGAIEFVD